MINRYVTMKNFNLVLLAFSCFLSACSSPAQQGPGDKDAPNILFLLADDLGYGDLSCFGSAEIETPNLDALAAGGIQLRNFYAASAVCTPSRAALLSGRYPIRFDIRQHFRDIMGEYLPVQELSLPWQMKRNGYRTFHIGKWHLGGLQAFQCQARAGGEAGVTPGPLEHGFDHYLANLEDTIRAELLRKARLYRDGGKYLVRDDRRTDPLEQHWTDIKTREAMDMMDASHNAGDPFFINLWFDVPHTPYEPAPEPHLGKYRKRGFTGNKLYYCSMVSHMDACIGQLIRHLKDLGIHDNTLIVFTSDNGPSFYGSTGYFKGGKADLHEGGIRVPFIASWPGRIPAGKVLTGLVAAHVDILPSFCEAAGIEYDSNQLDGISIMPWLLGEDKALPEREICWQLDLYTWFPQPGDKPEPYATTALLNGKFKLLADSLLPVELFDLREDPSEMKNNLEDRRALADSMASRIRATLAAPRLSHKAP
jgi:arylsulfatase A-like enzyme